MKIATWNINGVRNRLKPLLCWLDDCEADVVALQKIKVPEQEFPKDDFRAAGYYSEAHCYRKSQFGQADYGVAILTRREPRCVEKGLDGQEHLGARLLTVDVDGLEFSSVYAPWGKTEGIDAKLSWFDSLIDHLGKTRLRSKQRVLCGDFNVISNSRMRDGEARTNRLNCGAPLREKFNALTDAGALFDLSACRPPGWEDPFEFEDPELGESLEFTRLEYVLGTKPIVDRARVVKFDIEHAIVNNRPFYWVRAPIVAEFPD